jgi:hypothetical protein
LELLVEYSLRGITATEKGRSPLGLNPERKARRTESGEEMDSTDSDGSSAESVQERRAEKKLKDTKERDVKRLLGALKKITYDKLREKKERREEKTALKPVSRVYITLEDHIGLEHLKHRNGQAEELQTTLSKPHDSRKSPIRVFRLKLLKWIPYGEGEGGVLTRSPKVLLALEENVEPRLRIDGRKRRRPNSPGTSMRKHFNRPNRKFTRDSFAWRPDNQPVQKQIQKQTQPVQR